MTLKGSPSYSRGHGRIMHPPITAPKRGSVAFSHLSRRLSSSLPSSGPASPRVCIVSRTCSLSPKYPYSVPTPQGSHIRSVEGMRCKASKTHRVRLAAVHATHPHRAPFSHGQRFPGLPPPGFPPPSLLGSVMSRLTCLVGLARRHMRRHNGRDSCICGRSDT
ncbi:hypothetical protein BDP81DRAFT_421372 [Colletotrichum phormii]|uniref:Uncharacterized protein n=1 Tax=Colletotrichum phormii TaxID=359342 RepID=A0AAJ0EGQ7_9PEZI|nr:uncharacterized protein BDP81DRAFT_421372 [Colletotrichum phormii]KAK1639592.1 hypothetical protein BDP81DRAFT_421372 [Colletotrichum phormii]